MKAYNTTSYRFLFVVASRGIEPLSKVEETSNPTLSISHLRDYFNFS